MDNIGCKVIVSGHVQGVGFRYYTSQQAHLCDVTGHAKNLYNGNVEVLIYGRRTAVTQMLQWLNKGPASARVKEIKVTTIPYEVIKGFASY